MRETRSPSQILFSHLPSQTVDANRRVWRVESWVSPVTLMVDPDGVRRRVLAAIDPWRVTGNDGGLVDELHKGASIDVLGVNKEQGVKLELWPDIWLCSQCRRVAYQRGQCICGSKQWAQLPFVGFHECGYVGTPFIRKCATHNQAAVKNSSSSSIRDLVVECPICHQQIQKGLGGGSPCPACHQPGLNFNVHRASTVFTPHTFTMVNPARPENLRDLLANGGPEKSLRWVLDDMPTARPQNLAATRQSIVSDLIAKGLSPDVAAAAAAAAVEAGASQLDSTPAKIDLPAASLENAESSALEIALATFEGRRSASKLQTEPVDQVFQSMYERQYMDALERSGAVEIDYVDRFPVLRGVFGFSRGGGAIGASRLVPFRSKSRRLRVHADASETEAYYVRLDPVRVAAWLSGRGLLDTAPTNPRDARLAVLAAADFPSRGDDVITETVGSATLTLLHSFAHRMIRQLAVLAGIDRESISEYLVPEHLGVFIYATPRGSFVLGGLQSVFETDLHRLLDLQVDAESRCPLDPGCDRSGGACLACLQIGEPSCSYYNRFLDRKTLFGSGGFLRSDL